MNEWLSARHRVALAGWVLDGETGKPVSGASVVITAAPPAFKEKLAIALSAYVGWNAVAERLDKVGTGQDGLFYFPDLPAGWVLDGKTGKPVFVASVVITGAPPAFEESLAITSSAYANWNAMAERLDKVRTRQDGLFYFLDLPEGKYTVTGALPKSGRRYGVGQASSEVTRDDEGNVQVRFVTLTLPPTRVNGKVVGSAHKNGVAMAQVRVKGSGERTFTDAQGQYTVAAIEAGPKVLTVSAQGYQPKSEDVILVEPGTSKTINFSLTRETG